MPIKDLIDRKWTIIVWWRGGLHPVQAAPYLILEVFQHPCSHPTLHTLEHHLNTWKEASTCHHGPRPQHPWTLTFLPPFLLLAIGTAYAVLSNPEKRKQYDQFCDDKGQGHWVMATLRACGTSTAALRPTSPWKTSLTCFLVVAFHLVSFLLSPRSGLPGGDGGRWDASSSFPAAPLLTQSL